MASYVFPVAPKYGKSVFQFKISLQYPKPPIWRRVLVPGDYSFKDLHFVIQSIMSWSNTHMHKFDFKDRLSGENIDVGGVGDLGFGGWWPESTKLQVYFKKENDKATYDYDFGCTWYHNIILEKILPANSSMKYPQCITGRRASPPEYGFPNPEDFKKLGVFDAKLITFQKCRDFLTGDEEVQSKDLPLNQNVSDSSNVSNYDDSMKSGSASSDVESDPERIASCSKLATNLVAKAKDKQQKSIDCCLTQNSNKSISPMLPQKRKASKEEEPQSVPAKLIVLESNGLQKNSNSVLEMATVIENSKSDPSNSNINVPTVTEDTEDYYGKFIASQMRDIKDLKKREDLRIEIQQLITKYRFKN